MANKRDSTQQNIFDLNRKRIYRSNCTRIQLAGAPLLELSLTDRESANKAPGVRQLCQVCY